MYIIIFHTLSQIDYNGPLSNLSNYCIHSTLSIWYFCVNKNRFFSLLLVMTIKQNEYINCFISNNLPKMSLKFNKLIFRSITFTVSYVLNALGMFMLSSCTGHCKLLSFLARPLFEQLAKEFFLHCVMK